MKTPWLLEMFWNDLCFCHWRIPPSLVSPYLPAGWTVDTYDDAAWLSIVPFTMSEVRLRGLPILPGFQAVPELNLRTYVRRGNQRAVFFFSLDAGSRMLVWAAGITTGVAYRYARISLEKEDNGIFCCRSERKSVSPAVGKFLARYQPLAERVSTERGSVEEFLHERYTFVTSRNLLGWVQHEPYQLQKASVDISDNSLSQILSYLLPPKPDMVFYAKKLQVRASYGVSSR